MIYRDLDKDALIARIEELEKELQQRNEIIPIQPVDLYDAGVLANCYDDLGKPVCPMCRFPAAILKVIAQAPRTFWQWLTRQPIKQIKPRFLIQCGTYCYSHKPILVWPSPNLLK